MGPDYIRLPQPDCPDCHCCSAVLCARGRTTVSACAGKTSREAREIVDGCPCSAQSTTGTAAWHAAKISLTRLAMGKGLSGEAEELLSGLATGEVLDGLLGPLEELTRRWLVEFVDLRPQPTDLGHVYLSARRLDEWKRGPVVVMDVDERERTAQVVVTAWKTDELVTVHVDQLVGASGLQPGDLPGKFMEAAANCAVEDADHLVLLEIRMAPALASWAGPAGGAE
ncbi:MULTISPECIES: hypothetical protein [unclassified Streptomyces]|uniref:hypothetical protein n=1 Tax=unclassified Streptomyces TaxID=2593676 RepID=UPI00131A2728|nr:MULTISPECIES: hypothetical protein [unclassified Streptomyces]MYX33455.1 hypothetical protein [Streptomyces sp. SID8377]